jgi:two-component system, OmpR family, response regulator MtrA
VARIIYVEDDPLIADVVKSLLTQAGHLIGVIEHGTLAFETIAFKKPDLVILDRKLPGMQGMDILRALRRVSGLHLTPVLMLTATGGEMSIDEAMAAGANEYLVKPFTPEQLVESVNQALERNSLRNKNK